MGLGGYSQSQVKGMIEWSQKSRPKNIPRASSKTPKNPWTKNKPPKNPMPILWPLKVPQRGDAMRQYGLLYNMCNVKEHHSLLLNNSKTHLFLYFIRRTTQPGHYRFILIPPKKSLFKSSYPKNTCQIFVPKKSQNQKFQAQKILQSSPSLEIPSTPPGSKTHSSL